MIKKIICRAVGHRLVAVGECPYSLKFYDFCERCKEMISRNDEVL
jgi:hypothetical protein